MIKVGSSTSVKIVRFVQGKYTTFMTLIIQFLISSLLIPGVALINRGFLAFAYGMALIYLFLGISIVAEIFMEAIE